MNSFNYSVTHQQTSPRSKLLDQRSTTYQCKHTLNDYGLLNRAITQQSKKTKRKKLRKPSLQVYSDHQHHCQSLDKLTFLHEQKNQQIRSHIYEKAALQAQNEELKLNLLNPTVRQNELHNKIQQLQTQLQSLSQQMQQKQLMHKKQIQQLKAKHQAELLSVRQRYSKPQVEVKPSNVRYYEPYKGSQRQISPPKQVIRTYENDKRLIVENSKDMSPHKAANRVYPESRESNSRNVQYLTAQPTQPIKIEQNVRSNVESTTSMGYQNVFIKPQSNYSPPIYTMNPNFVRQTDSPKKHTPDTSKNTTLTYTLNKNEVSMRGESNTFAQASNRLNQREISPQYRTNVYSYEKVGEGTKGSVAIGKTQSQNMKLQNRTIKPTIISTTTKQPLQANKTGVSERQIDDIYKRYYLNDK